MFSECEGENGVVFIGTAQHNTNKLGMVCGKYNNNKLEYRELNCGFKNTDCEKNWVFLKSQCTFYSAQKNVHTVYWRYSS